MPLRRDTIAEILKTASPQIRRDYAGAHFTVLCTVEEGTACRFAASDWADAALAELGPRIIDELGWKAIEYAPRRQVVLRCVAPDSEPGRATCECDYGSGFVPIELADA